jgi:hypothetical protein
MFEFNTRERIIEGLIQVFHRVGTIRSHILSLPSLTRSIGWIISRSHILSLPSLTLIPEDKVGIKSVRYYFAVFSKFPINI